MRERKRLPAMGITHFETDPACDTIVFLNSKVPLRNLYYILLRLLNMLYKILDERRFKPKIAQKC